MEYVGRGLSSVNYPLRLKDPSEDLLPPFQVPVYVTPNRHDITDPSTKKTKSSLVSMTPVLVPRFSYNSK